MAFFTELEQKISQFICKHKRRWTCKILFTLFSDNIFLKILIYFLTIVSVISIRNAETTLELSYREELRESVAMFLDGSQEQNWRDLSALRRLLQTLDEKGFQVLLLQLLSTWNLALAAVRISQEESVLLSHRLLPLASSPQLTPILTGEISVC